MRKPHSNCSYEAVGGYGGKLLPTRRWTPSNLSGVFIRICSMALVGGSVGTTTGVPLLLRFPQNEEIYSRGTHIGILCFSAASF